MSDVEGRDDDLDEVTLWSGRLRAWPVVPPEGGTDDDTVRSRRAAPDASPPATGSDDTAPSVPGPSRTRASSLSASPTADAMAPPGSPTAEASAEDAVDEATAPTRSRRSRTAGRGRRAADDTAPSVAGPELDPSATVVATHGEPTEEPLPEHEVTVRVRDVAGRRDSPGDGSVAEDIAVGEDYPRDDDNTAAGTRTRRREATPSVDDDVPGAVREAYSPMAQSRDVYAPRVDAPARVSRAVPGPLTSTGDAASVSPRRARGRGRLLVLAVMVVAVVAAAAVGVALLLG